MFIIPVVFYLAILSLGFPYMKSRTEKYGVNKTFWYVFLFLMPIVALIAFYFSEVKHRDA
jgi:hypothetical protein